MHNAMTYVTIENRWAIGNVVMIIAVFCYYDFFKFHCLNLDSVYKLNYNANYGRQSAIFQRTNRW
jgi:hypothetical protein